MVLNVIDLLNGEYNLLLPARSEKIESVDMSGAFAYFIDAMGVEFLGYISEIQRPLQ